VETGTHEGRRRFIRQLLLGLLGVGSIAVLVWKVPRWMLAHAEKSADECFERYDQDARGDRKRAGDVTACRRDGWLAIPELLPHTRAAAKAEARSVSNSIEYRIENAATRRDSTAAERERARLAILKSDDAPDDKAHSLVQLGAYEDASRPDPAHVTELPRAAVSAALVVGDVARAKKLVQLGESHEVSAGALACLLGARERGVAILAADDARWRGKQLGGTSRIAAVLCGATTEAFGADPTAVSSVYDGSMFVARLYDPAFQANRRGTIGRRLRESLSTTFAHVRLAANALAIAGTPETETAELLRLVAGRYAIPLDGLVVSSPWGVLRGHWGDDGVAYAPAQWFADAATRLRAALAKPPAKLPADDGGLSDLDAIDDAFRRDPHAAFRRALPKLDALATLFALRAGRKADALRTIELLRTSAPDSLDLAALELAFGEPERALAVIARWEKATTEDEGTRLRTVAAMQRSLAHAALGDHAAAHAAALAAATAKDPVIDWLVLATAIASKQPLVGLPIANRKSLDRDSDAAAWAKALVDPRAKVPSWYDLDAELVLPAVFTVIGHAATVAGGDPERYLDAELDREPASRSLLRARAEAARWRGDRDSALQWDARAARIEALFTDDRAVALAGMAKLW
jgi:hypothetical protein